MSGSTVSGKRSRRKCCFEMNFKSLLLAVLTMGIVGAALADAQKSAERKSNAGKAAAEPSGAGESGAAPSVSKKTGSSRPSDEKPGSDEIVMERALVAVIEQAEIPAKVEGVLAAVDAREGQVIERGAVVARIEDTEVR